MEFNLTIPESGPIHQLYKEVAILATNRVRSWMNFESATNGMKSNMLDLDRHFQFVDDQELNGLMTLQNTFRYLGRKYNVNVLMEFDGEYFLPRDILYLQFHNCWDHVVTPCLLPVHVELCDAGELEKRCKENPVTHLTEIVDRRKFGCYSEEDGLSEFIRFDLPERIFQEMIYNPLFLDPEFFPLLKFDKDAVNVDFKKPLDELENKVFLYDTGRCADKGDFFFSLGAHAWKIVYPNEEFFLKCMETAAEENSFDAMALLSQAYYYKLYGLETNYEKVFKYIKMMMDSNHEDRSYAYILYADCYLEGKGVEKDVDKALEMYKSVLPNEMAYFNLAIIYAKGSDVEQNIELAQEYMDRAREGGVYKILNDDTQMAQALGSEEIVANHNEMISDLELVLRVLAAHGDEQSAKELEEISTYYIPTTPDPAP